MRAIGLAIAGLIACTGNSGAQEAGRSGARLRLAYTQCAQFAFFDAVLQEKLPDLMAAERAFQACLTEEQAIYAALALSGLPPAQILATISNLKLQVKNSLLSGRPF